MPRRTPTGTVTFTENGRTIGTAELDADGVATLVTDTLPAGQHTITARYEGDGRCPASTSEPVTVTVTALQSGLSLTKSVSPEEATAADQVVRYAFKVTNTGETTLTDLAVTEQKFTGSGGPLDVTCPEDTLAAGEEMPAQSWRTPSPGRTRGAARWSATSTGTSLQLHQLPVRVVQEEEPLQLRAGRRPSERCVPRSLLIRQKLDRHPGSPGS